MYNVVLYQPEIPPNTGNIIRLCANSGAQLHLIHPLGFVWDDKRLRRAGLDYHEFTNIHHHESYEQYCQNAKPKRIFALSTKGKTRYFDAEFEPDDHLLFGPETRGLPDDVLTTFDSDHLLTIPMKANSRSLNLSNSVAIVLFEGLRQLY